MIFASDNAAPVPSEIIQALTRANDGHASSYGTDTIMARVRAQIRDIFEAPSAAVYLVGTGTAANALALSVLASPVQTIFCHRLAHAQVDECNAPEFFTGGAKLTLLEGDDGKIDLAGFKARAAQFNNPDVHRPQFGALTLTNVTEMGTTYTLNEMRALTDVARALGMGTHLDGARFTNALVALGCTPAEMTWKSGFDIVSFGGTKNGLMGVEAVIIFDPKKAWELELRRKRSAHLFSKHRYLSAQMEAYLNDDLWIRLATHANAAAARLEQKLSAIEGFRLLTPRAANMLFCGWPRDGHKRAQDAGAYYYPAGMDHPETGPENEFLDARLVCSWCTTNAEIDAFAATVAG